MKRRPLRTDRPGSRSPADRSPPPVPRGPANAPRGPPSPIRRPGSSRTGWAGDPPPRSTAPGPLEGLQPLGGRHRLSRSRASRDEGRSPVRVDGLVGERRSSAPAGRAGQLNLDAPRVFGRYWGFVRRSAMWLPRFACRGILQGRAIGPSVPGEAAPGPWKSLATGEAYPNWVRTAHPAVRFAWRMPPRDRVHQQGIAITLGGVAGPTVRAALSEFTLTVAGDTRVLGGKNGRTRLPWRMTR
jgi:hypothetical protein